MASFMFFRDAQIIPQKCGFIVSGVSTAQGRSLQFGIFFGNNGCNPAQPEPATINDASDRVPRKPGLVAKPCR
jgi:hypothetical protein